jgi:hypothetical protein
MRKRASVPAFFLYFLKMKKYITCPKCREKRFDKKKKRCLNEECTLFHAANHANGISEPVDWKTRLWSIWYWRPRNGYYWFRNRFFRRYDLVRTGLSKSTWCDIDYKMLYAVMGLVESFVVNEEGIYFVDIDKESDSLRACCRDQNRKTQKVLDLYVDWKVTYPYMLQKHHEMLMDDVTPNDVYFAYEEEIEKYENQLMRRAINLRRFMWT